MIIKGYLIIYRLWFYITIPIWNP